MSWDVWAAAWVILGGCHDWEFDGFRDRLVALGRATFERALEDPDSLADVTVDWTAGVEEGDVWLSIATAEAYEALTGSGLDEAEGDSVSDPVEPTGSPRTLATVADRVPRLAAACSFDPAAVTLREPCPCCGSLTIEEPGAYEICGVCWWEDETYAPDYPDEPSGPNGISLTQARANFRRLGACDERSRSVARPPRPWEIAQP